MSRAALVALAAVLARAQDFSNVKLELAAQGLVYAQGPAWSRDGFLIFSDTVEDKLYKLAAGHEAEVYRTGASGPAGNAFDAEGRLYTCETRARRVTRTDKKGKIEVLAERWEGKRLNAPNDIVVNQANGRAYFTDPAFGYQQDQRELDFCGVYEIPPHGPLKLAAKPAGRPNGVALSPNGRILYVANADERNVREYTLDRAGDLSGERVLIARTDGVPNGIRTDEKGNLYVAGRGVAVYSPDGRLIHNFELVRPASNCGFGGADGRYLFIASGGNLYRARLDVKGAY